MNNLEYEDTEFLLNTLTSMAITSYNLGTMRIDIDLSSQFSEITKELKNRGITLEQIDKSIKTKDFTNMLTNYGSGNGLCYNYDLAKYYLRPCDFKKWEKANSGFWDNLDLLEVQGRALYQANNLINTVIYENKLA